MSNVVHVLSFVRAREEQSDIELLIGVYSSKDEANDAINRLRDKPGFADFPKGFEIAPYELDRDHWVDGFKFVV